MLQSHPFFDGVDWDNLYSTQAPHKPTVKHPLDTQNFENFDEQAPVALNPGGMKRWARADPNFVGYTYKNWEAVQPGAHDRRSPYPLQPALTEFLCNTCWCYSPVLYCTFSLCPCYKHICTDISSFHIVGRYTLLVCFSNGIVVAASGRMQLKKKTPTRPSIQQLQGGISAMSLQDN